MNKFSEYVLYSGGAYGADTLWGILAHKYGLYRQFHIRPKGNEKIHKSLLALGFNPYVAGEFELQVARDEIRELLGMNLTPSLGSDLKARNYYQVAKSECVIAVAKLDGLSVKGGTDVAVQLGISLKLPTYVLDVETERWYRYSNGFEPCDTPKLYRKTTLVGTRDIEDYKVLKGDWVSRPEFVGKDKANRIKSLMEQVFIKSLEMPKVELQDRFSVYDTKNNPDKVYVYGDNLLRQGKKGQAIIRDCDNAFGIATKKLPSMTEWSFFTDSEFKENKRVIEEGIRNVLDNYGNRVIVFPRAGLGTGLAQLNTRAPRTYQYLCKRLHDEFGVRYD